MNPDISNTERGIPIKYPRIPVSPKLDIDGLLLESGERLETKRMLYEDYGGDRVIDGVVGVTKYLIYDSRNIILRHYQTPIYYGEVNTLPRELPPIPEKVEKIEIEKGRITKSRRPKKKFKRGTEKRGINDEIAEQEPKVQDSIWTPDLNEQIPALKNQEVDFISYLAENIAKEFLKELLPTVLGVLNSLIEQLILMSKIGKGMLVLVEIHAISYATTAFVYNKYNNRVLPLSKMWKGGKYFDLSVAGHDMKEVENIWKESFLKQHYKLVEDLKKLVDKRYGISIRIDEINKRKNPSKSYLRATKIMQEEEKFRKHMIDTRNAIMQLQKKTHENEFCKKILIGLKNVKRSDVLPVFIKTIDSVIERNDYPN